MRTLGGSAVRGYLAGLAAVITALGAGQISLWVNPPDDSGPCGWFCEPGVTQWWEASVVTGEVLLVASPACARLARLPKPSAHLLVAVALVVLAFFSALEITTIMPASTLTLVLLTLLPPLLYSATAAAIAARSLRQPVARTHGLVR